MKYNSKHGYNSSTRRNFIKATTIGVVGLSAGCSDSTGNGSDSGSTGSGSDSGSTGSGSDSGSQTVVVGENPSAGVLSAAPRIADERGFVEESDVTFEYRQYGVGIEIMRNLSSGQANFGADGATWAALLMGAQGDVSYASHSWDAPLEQFIVQEDIEEITDLEGRKIAAISGSIWDWLTAQMFQQADGISLDDVEIQNFSAPSDIVAALQSGRIAGGWLFLQTLTEAKKSDSLHPLIDLRDVAPKAAETFGAMTWQQSWAEENQDAAAETLRMVEEGQTVMKEEPEAAASIISDSYEIPEDQVLANLQDTSFFVGLRDELISEVFPDMYQFAVERDIYDEYDWKQAVSVEVAEQAFPDKVTWSR